MFNREETREQVARQALNKKQMIEWARRSAIAAVIAAALKKIYKGRD
jgi:hypothetical protein